VNELFSPLQASDARFIAAAFYALHLFMWLNELSKDTDFTALSRLDW
jgi:hypothetical protein